MGKYKNEQDRIQKQNLALHNNTIDKLVSKLKKDSYLEIGSQYDYDFNDPKRGFKKIHGEMDAYAIKNVNGKKYILVFEVKGVDKEKYYNHALKQLDKDLRYMKQKEDYDRIFQFFVKPCKTNGCGYTAVWVNKGSSLE